MCELHVVNMCISTLALDWARCASGGAGNMVSCPSSLLQSYGLLWYVGDGLAMGFLGLRGATCHGNPKSHTRMN